MSGEAEKTIESLSKLTKMLPWVRGIVLGAFAIGAWTSTLEWRSRSQAEEGAEAKDQISQLVRWRAGAEASAFSLREGNELDKRIARLEGEIGAVRSSLERIERAMGTR